MNNINIRKATIKDLATIQSLSQELFKHDSKWDPFFNMSWSFGKAGETFFRKILTNKKSICFIAEVKSETAGYLAASILPTNAWRPVKRSEITNLFIKEKFRSMNVGTKLAEEFFEWSKKQGIKHSVVVANAMNKGALNFYKQKGFSPFLITLETERGG